MSSEVQPVLLKRELVRTREGAQDSDGIWVPHEFQGKRQTKVKCDWCGHVLSNGLTKAYLNARAGAAGPMVHHAYPASINEGGSGYDRGDWQRKKEAWQYVYCQMLEEADLPQPLGFVLMEAEWTFPQRYGQGPDQDNYRYPASKFFGDALKVGGWLQDDWWMRYEFGNAQYNMERGVRRWVATLFPRALDAQLPQRVQDRAPGVPQGTLL